MDKGKEYRFRIDAFTPQSIPMARLAEYMADLAVLLGQKERVHFVGVEKGSVVLVQNVEDEATPKVRERLAAVHNNIAPHDAMKAFREIDKRLAADNAVGHLCLGEAEIIHFPGCEKKQPLSFGAFTEHGSLDGVLIKIGGKDETVPTHLLDGKIVHICNSSRELARDIAQHLFRETLRVHGDGRWETSYRRR